jgi:hypothetical protein
VSHAPSWSPVLFYYHDDFGTQLVVRLNDYIGDAGGLQRIAPNEAYKGRSRGNVHLRYVRVRAVEPETDGRKSYKNIPVELNNSLWTGLLGQRLVVAGQEMEVMRKVDEVEYGRKGAASERKKLKARRSG